MGKLTNKAATILLIISLTTISGCIHRTHDHMFAVTGMVVDENGAALNDADVSLTVYGPVYAGLSPVRSEEQHTNSAGEFVFMHISHQQGVKYILTIRKSGFESQTVTGNAPPDGHHTIRLKQAAAQNPVA